MSKQTQHSEQVNNERNIAPFIPYSSHLSDNTIITKDGDLMRTWKVGGISFETKDFDEILLRKEQLNTLFRSIGSDNVSLWTHNLRRRTSDTLHSNFDNSFSQDFDKKYYESFNGYRMMANELYLTVRYRPSPSKIEKAMKKSARRSQGEIKKANIQALGVLDKLGNQIESSLGRYNLQILGKYWDDEKVAFSSSLRFLNFLLSGEWQEVRVPESSLDQYLGTAWIFAGSDTLQIRAPSKTRYAQGIDFKDYSAHTEPGILNGLMYEGYEYVITQSYSFLGTRAGKTALENQIKQLNNAEDGAMTQIEEMTIAIDHLLQGEFSMGEYHYSLMIFGDTKEEVKNSVGSAISVIQDRGFLAVLIATANEAAFYAQLPCNWAYRPRVAMLTSRNLAGLSSFHNFSAGKRDGNPWGQAVTLLKTPSGQPLYFNYHYSKGSHDAFDEKVLGNTRVIGQSGSGKTVLLNTLLVESQKFKTNSDSGFTTVFFDKDEGAKLCIKAIGGNYLSIKNGQPTGLNPFQMEATEANILFLEKLVKVLVSGDNQTITTSDELRISASVRTLMEMKKEHRRLSILLQNMTEGGSGDDKENSIVKRLSKWCVDNGEGREGSLAWVLDCESDVIDFSSHANYGFDGTDFLDNDDVRTPISMYLLHRMESIIDGRRFIYFMDEAWKWVDDEAFADFAGNKQLTIRKQNGLGVFATQMPSSLLNSKIASSLVQQCATEIYLPNPKADRDEYINGFKVTEAEFEIIKSMAEDSRMFLIKQGAESMIGQLDLGGFDDDLAILSGSIENNELVDSVINEVGDNPEAWLPIFHQQRKARMASSKLKAV